MTISVLQEGLTANDTSANTSVAFTFSSNLTAGSTIHLVVQSNGATVTSISDTLGNVYTQRGTLTAVSGKKYAQYTAPVPVGGANSVTANFSFSINGRAIAAKEIGGAAQFSYDTTLTAANQTAPGLGTDAVTTSSVANTSQPALISSFCFQTADQTHIPNAGSGFVSSTNGATATIQSYRFESKRITTTTSVAATYTAAAGGGSLEHNTLAVVLDELVVLAPQPIPPGARQVFVNDIYTQF